MDKALNTHSCVVEDLKRESIKGFANSHMICVSKKDVCYSQFSKPLAIATNLKNFKYS